MLSLVVKYACLTHGTGNLPLGLCVWNIAAVTLSDNYLLLLVVEVVDEDSHIRTLTK